MLTCQARNSWPILVVQFYEQDLLVEKQTFILDTLKLLLVQDVDLCLRTMLFQSASTIRAPKISTSSSKSA
jgi:hypothetical protein